MERIVLIGGGGHAAVVLDAAMTSPAWDIVAILGTAEEVGASILGQVISGTDADLPALAAAGATHFIVAVGSIGDASLRERLHAAALAAGLAPATVIHPSAVVAVSAQIGAGAYVGALAHVGPRASIGEAAIVNTHASVDHDCAVGRFAHVAPGAVLSGGVTVGDGTHIGTGAAVSHGVIVGARTVVGAGATVVRDLPAGVVAYGTPAVVRREVRP